MPTNLNIAEDDSEDEVTALVHRLHETQQRLQELAGGEVDAVLHAGGQSYLLHAAQEKLRQSEAAQRGMAEMQMAILNALPAHIALLDAQGVILSVNEAWRRFATANVLQGSEFGVGQNYLEVCTRAQGDCSDEAEDVARGIRRVLRGETSEFILEYPCHSPAEKRWYRLMVAPLQEGRLSGAVVMHVNITERKLAEEALRESEGRFRGTFEQAAVGIAHVSTEGRFLRVNDTLCAIFGYDREELLELTSADLTVPEDRAACEEARLAMVAGNPASYDTEKRYLRKSGEEVWTRLVINLQRPTVGEPRYFISVFEDITARKLTEFRLHRLNRLHTVLSKVGEAIVRTRARQELYETVCRIVVDDGLLRMACVMEVDVERSLALPAASAGVGRDYLGKVTVTTDGGQLSQDTIGTTLRTGRLDFCNNFASDARMEPWRENALRRGFLSTASFPLKLGEATIGALVLFAGETGYFQDDEIGLMTGVASAVSFALEALQKEEQRQEATLALRASEVRMATAQRVGHFGSWELDLTATDDGDAKPLHWSDEMFRIAGHEPGVVEATKELFFHLVPEEEHKPVREAMAAAVRERRPYSMVHRLIRPDGGERVVHEVGQIFLDEKTGQPAKMIGIAHDITEQRQAEEALRQKDALIRIAGRVTRTGGWALEMPSQRVFWSDEVFDILEYPRGLEPTLAEGMALYPEPWRARITAAIDACVRDGTPFDMETEILAAQQRRIWVRVCGEAETHADGSIKSVQGAFQDITERKQSEVHIAEQAALIDEARDAIYVRDLDHRITFWNKGAERLFGWTAEEVRGSIVQELLQVDPVRAAEAEDAVRSAGGWHGEIQKYARDGSVLTLDARWTLVRDAHGEPQSILSINTDITERKKIEQQFLRAQRMESIGTLAGGIAHDLNNSLGPIIMALDLLKMRFPDPDSAELLAIISTSAHRGADMVRQVLSFARGVEGRRMEVQVKHLLQEIEKIATDTFPKNIEVRTILPNDLWPVIGDPTQLHQVLLNLCVNARDAMPDGGTLTLLAENLTLDAHYAGLSAPPEAQPGPYVFLQVKDSGTGMPPEVLQKIFDPFFTTKELGKGTGLGLSTSLGIVKSHGGFFRVESEPGNGTKFQVYLPAQAGISADTTAQMAAEMPRGNGELILVVDDETTVRQITQQTLEAFGYRVIPAANGTEAVAVYAQRGREIAAVLTDMMMPVMDGPVTIKVLRKMNPAVRIIAASGLSGNAHVASVASLGITHFLSKPYTAETLLKTLRDVLAP